MKHWLIFVVSFCFVVISKGQVTWHKLGFEYYIYTGGKVNYQAAVNACTSMNATLARIKTKQVQDFVMEKIKLLYPGTTWKHFYIGLNRINSSSTGFQWNDGTIVTSGYTNWYPGEPNNDSGNENCVVLFHRIGLSSHGKWNDLPCSGKWRYICERSVEKDTTTQLQTTTNIQSTDKPTTYDKTLTDTQSAFTTTTTNNDPLEQMKTCEFSTIHVVMSSLGSIVGTSVVFIIGILIYCKKRRNNDVTVSPPPQQELYLEPIPHDINDGYITFEPNQ
ncbi:chondrolectin-like isoform X2 [Ciona intestinalis]